MRTALGIRSSPPLSRASAGYIVILTMPLWNIDSESFRELKSPKTRIDVDVEHWNRGLVRHHNVPFMLVLLLTIEKYRARLRA